MRQICIKWFASISLIITLIVAGTPLAGQAAPEVVAWGENSSGQTDVPSGLSDVVAVAAGWRFSLALTAEGRVIAWGSNGCGQTDVPRGLSNVVGIAAGFSHSLALTAQGRVVQWPDRHDNVTTGVPSGLSNVVGIAAGEGHSLALTAEGRVVAWGNNDSGQTNVPNGLGNVMAIAAGGGCSLAVTVEGRVVAWGSNAYGQTDVPSGLSNVVSIAASDLYSLALTTEGQVVSWGLNWNGLWTMPAGLSNVVAIAAGGGLVLTAQGRVVALDGTAVPSGLSNVVAIAEGGGVSLALTGVPPSLAAPAWVGPRFLVATMYRPFHYRIIAKNGVDTYGASGLPPGLVLDQNTGVITGQPAQTGKYAMVLSATNSVGSSTWTVTLFINQPAAPAIASSGLVLVGLGNDYAVVANNAPDWYGASGLPAGLVIDPHTGVISGMPLGLGDFVVSLVASNRYGLGTGSLTMRVSPVVAWGAGGLVQTDVPIGLSNVVAISVGGGFSLALTSEGSVVSWGSDYNGGDSVAMAVPGGLSNVVAIAAGYEHSLALTAQGQVVAWGNNGSGQTTVPSGLSNVVGIAAGSSHSLALTAQGRVVQWPDRHDNVTTGVPSGLSNVVAIAAGGEYSLALTPDGQVVAWGYNGRGNLDVPGGLSNVVAIAAGGFGLALKADGQVVQWPDRHEPFTTAVPSGLSNVVAIAAGGGFSLALTTDGRAVAWGGSYLQDTGGIPPRMTVPGKLSNVVTIAAGGAQGLALLRQPTVSTPRLALSRGSPGLQFRANGAPGIFCQLLHASRLSGPWLPAEPVTFTNYVQSLRPPEASAPAQFFRLLRK